MKMSPADHRALLSTAMQRIMDGELPIAAAQAVAVLSHEIHQSIEQEFEIRKHALLNYNKEGARVLMIETGVSDD